jgi:Na+/proline symporter
MDYLGSLDYGVIIFYFIILIGIGLYLKKRASRGLESYFLANKRLPWWMLGVTGMGWSLDVTGTMLIISLLYLLGPRGLFIEFRGGANLSLIFMMIWTGKWHRRSGCMTGGEWMTYRFGDTFGGKFARASFAASQIIFTVGMLAYMIKGVGLFASMFIPFSPFVCSLIVIGVATIYTVSSGFYGVVFSDLFQCALVVIGASYITIMALTRIDDGSTFVTMAERITDIPEWGTGYPQIEATMPKAYEAYHCLFMFTVFLIIRNVILGFGSGPEPHYFGARNERECGKLTCLWACLLTSRWPMMIGFAVLGIYLVNGLFSDMGAVSQVAELIKANVDGVGKNQWPALLSNIMHHPENYSQQFITQLQQLLGENWEKKLHLVSYEGIINAERILPAVLLFNVPAGIRGIILVTLIAASMSTFDSSVNRATAFFTRDIYQKFFRPKAKRIELLTAIYIFTVSMVALAFLMGYTSKSINDIWGWIMMGLISGLSIPTVLRLYWWRFNGGGFTFGVVIGVACAILQRLFLPDLAEQWQFVILTSISLTAAVIGTFLSRPTDDKVLKHFYKTTRPFGLWKPMEHILPKDLQKAMRREHKNDLIAIPFGLCWIIGMFMLPITLIIQNFRASAAFGVLFAVGVAGLYKYWYKNLPPADAPEIEDFKG